jgi:hypothetical protein
VQKYREKTAKYCSKECKDKTQKTCIECGVGFVSSSSGKYCSLKCHNLARKKNPKYLTWLKNGAHSLAGRFNTSKFTAKQRGIEWLLSKEQYATLLSNKCFYCKKPTSVKRGCGLDRKDNNQPYTVDNVVACCHRCNSVKNDFFSFEEMLLLAKVIRKIDKLRG